MIIYVAGYPKSGTTWITRLLGDALDCRTGGSMPSQDSHEIATEGFERNYPWNIVRKGHFVLDNVMTKHPVCKPHRMNWKALRAKDHKVVFVIRDPRDVAVSGAFHWNVPVRSFLQNMVRGVNGLRSIGPWNVYIHTWLETQKKFGAITVRYEDMLLGPETLEQLVRELAFEVEVQRIEEAYERQRFENRLKDIVRNGHLYNLGNNFNVKFMRKGIAGDWRNHFSRVEAFESEAHFGDLLRYFNYESNPQWWRSVL